ncbi:hypothetical protein PVL29_026803 [Vitis rotundifolia]|uniref:Uncharacterized protein n=1 Tax=Vitis rotundifolia TaxID=103349 RepID=A0AA39D5B1_VITRO|nr:hypothetical protein PVL29_026803 [Vitis rotundifolia]
MEQTESDIKRVLQDYQKIGSSARCEEDQVRGSGSVELERHRMQNLLDYQSTLIARAASRTEKQLRGSDGAEGSGVDAAPNVSLSSALSGGDENQRFTKNCSELRSMHIMRMSHHEDLEEEITLLQINMNEDAFLISENGCKYGDLQYKNSILDNIAISILDPNANIDNIFKEAVENSNILCVESEGTFSLSLYLFICYHDLIKSCKNHIYNVKVKKKINVVPNPQTSSNRSHRPVECLLFLLEFINQIVDLKPSSCLVLIALI